MNRHIAPPEFAMSFTQEAVLLEHRDGFGWRPLGQAPFAGREMTARLAALRAQAGVGQGDLDTVLIIPDDQILYTTLTVPAGTDTPRAVARALEAMTPYSAEELAFDWCPSETGDIETLRIAAVARRTLEEAEDFARAQGFRPSGFVARPDDARFDGQPDFGPSRLASGSVIRMPFSEPDLAQARVTDPVVANPEAADPAPATTEAAPAPVSANPVISRIVPHLAQPQASAGPARAEVTPVQTPDEADVETVSPSAAVIRHGEAKAPAAPRVLPPRAQALHDRVREAMAARASAPEDTDPPAPSLLSRLRRLDPGRLPVMMGLLVAGLVLVLAFFGTKPASETAPPAEIASPAAAPQPVDPAPVPAPSPAPAEVAVTPPQADPAPAAPAPAPVDTALSPAEESPVEAQAPADAPAQTDLAARAPAPGDAPPSAQPPSATADAVPPASAPAGLRPDATAPEAVTAARPLPAPAQPQAQPQPGEQAPAPQDDDALTRALAEAMNSPAPAPAQAPISAATMAGDLAEAPRPAQPAPAPAAASAAPAAAAPAAAAPAAPARASVPARPQLASSARPPRVAPVRVSAPARTDARPAVPANPRPFPERARPEAPQPPAARPAPSRPQAPQLSATRPPERPALAVPASRPPAAAASRAVPEAAPQAGTGSSRPPARPERQGSLEEGSRSEDGQPTRLTRAEEQALEDLLRDLRTAQAGARGLSGAERGALLRLADARPTRKPVAVGAPSQRAVREAVAAAVADAGRPEARTPPRSTATGLGRSARPAARPGGSLTATRSDPGPGNASLSSGAIDRAVAAAVSESSSLPGAVALTALRSSALPPRRAGGAAAAAAATVTAAAAPLAPTPDDLRAAAQAQSEEAALAEQRRQDAELQAQAEARARARAAQDAQAEAQARAQAEARARAQAEAEARAAAARQQRYAPPEAEDEPEVTASIPDGRTPTTAGVAATVKDGIQINRTQIIGTIGAGKASRALVRLSNGRVLTLRLGDKINGGTITDIRDSRITFVKGGQAQALTVLGGR